MRWFSRLHMQNQEHLSPTCNFQSPVAKFHVKPSEYSVSLWPPLAVDIYHVGWGGSKKEAELGLGLWPGPAAPHRLWRPSRGRPTASARHCHLRWCGHQVKWLGSYRQYVDDRLYFVAQFSCCHLRCPSVRNTEPEVMAVGHSTLHKSFIGVSPQHTVWMNTIKGLRLPFLFFYCWGGGVVVFFFA